ncbi:MAG: cell envelope biogenesis protein OmpA [Aureispira sp.]|nr:cell envelope biogenesis protein OmpA [Aureispira sp.]
MESKQHNEKPDKLDPSKDKLLEDLRHILLEKDREELERLKYILETPDELEHYTASIIDKRVEQRVERLRQEFRSEFGEPVEKIIEQKIEMSKNELLDVLTPVFGKMIRKYISLQFKLLREQIEKQLKKLKNTPKNFWYWFKSKFTGVNQGDLILEELDKPKIEAIYLIQKQSGLLLGSYARESVADEDMIAGMLTAIKAFVEDAFQKEQQELELIEWENYKVLIQNFNSYYIAVALVGNIPADYRIDLEQSMGAFVEKELQDKNFEEVDSEITQQVSTKIKEHFKLEEAND